jgi:hypothetical protein
MALRSANFRLQGSGQGSVSPRTYLAELPSLVEEITAGKIAVRANSVPLVDVENAWTETKPPASARSWCRSVDAVRGRDQWPGESRR